MSSRVRGVESPLKCIFSGVMWTRIPKRRSDDPFKWVCLPVCSTNFPCPSQSVFNDPVRRKSEMETLLPKVLISPTFPLFSRSLSGRRARNFYPVSMKSWKFDVSDSITQKGLLSSPGLIRAKLVGACNLATFMTVVTWLGKISGIPQQTPYSKKNLTV